MPAYYRATVVEFLNDDSERILGILAARNNWQGNGMVPDGISLRRRVDETENNPSEPNIQ